MVEHQAHTGGGHGTNDHGHGANDQGHGANDHGHGDHGGVGKYIQVFFALCVLTAISFGIGNSSLMDTPLIGWTGMMTVSCCKAMLVILFFMHLKYEANWKYVLTIPASIMSLFLLLMLVPDVGNRGRKYSEARKAHAASPRHEQHDESQHLGEHKHPRGESPPK